MHPSSYRFIPIHSPFFCSLQFLLSCFIRLRFIIRQPFKIHYQNTLLHFTLLYMQVTHMRTLLRKINSKTNNKNTPCLRVPI